MLLYSWNVNGLRACGRKGFADWLAKTDAFVVGIQELRARADQLDEPLRAPPGYQAYFQPAERAGYSGVGLYCRQEPDSLETTLEGEHEGEPFDGEGRLQIARFGRLVIANVYFPNGSGKQRDNGRVPFKLAFYRALFDRLARLRRGGLRVVVIGDYNTAHRDIDLARPKQNVKTSGFLPEEREELDRWIRAGWIDSFRALHPDEAGHYSWWSQRFGVREKNIGWRIDYALLSPSCRRFLQAAAIYPEVNGSDHCPISLTLDDAVCTR
jgi:exodeoxyribonuclease-3